MYPYIILFGHKVLVFNLVPILAYIIVFVYFYRAGINLRLSRFWLFFSLLLGFVVQLYGGTVLPFIYRNFILHQNLAFKLSGGYLGRWFISCFLSTLVYFILISKALKWPVKKILDIFMVSTMIMSAIGRLGCLAQGCCGGKPTSLPWAIKFPFNPSVAVHPTQIYMFFSELAIIGILIRLQRKRSYDGQTFWTGVFLYSIYRILIEFYRTNPVFLYGLTHAQFFSIITLCISGFYLYFKKFGMARGKQSYVLCLLSGGLFILGAYPFLGILLLVFAAFNAFFFRDPERTIAFSEKNILSPADGRIKEITHSDIDPIMQTSCTKISIYLSLFNVHVNRSPIEATVKSLIYSPGRFHFAFHKNAITNNENNLITITNNQTTIIVKQIAGKLARRIRCYCKKGDLIRQGERIGIIEFGSCVQIYIPDNFRIRVKTGEKVTGGQTILATLKE